MFLGVLSVSEIVCVGYCFDSFRDASQQELPEVLEAAGTRGQFQRLAAGSLQMEQVFKESVAVQAQCAALLRRCKETTNHFACSSVFAKQSHSRVRD